MYVCSGVNNANNTGGYFRGSVMFDLIKQKNIQASFTSDD